MPHTDIGLTKEQSDFVRRRVEGFANRHGVQTMPLVHLLQEAYLQGMSDAAEFAKAVPCPPHKPVTKSEGDTRMWKECEKCGEFLREMPIPNNA